ncbi:MAG: hypothetical protein AVDCRST_MAG54-672, partial [uncultured Actinomycetospora sp.]
GCSSQGNRRPVRRARRGHRRRAGADRRRSRLHHRRLPLLRRRRRGPQPALLRPRLADLVQPGHRRPRRQGPGHPARQVDLRHPGRPRHRGARRRRRGQRELRARRGPRDRRDRRQRRAVRHADRRDRAPLPGDAALPALGRRVRQRLEPRGAARGGV